MQTCSWTEINTYRSCPHKHKLHYVEKWRPSSMARPLRLGILVHEVLEIHHKGIRDHRDTQREVHDFLMDNGALDERAPNHEDALTAWWIYDGYVERYGPLNAEWEVVEVEMEVRQALPEVDGRAFELYGRVDLLVKVNGKHLYVVDHKTGKYLPKDQELALADQFGLYIWALKQQGYPIQGAIYDAMRTHRTKGDLDGSKPLTLDQRFSREWTYRSDYELNLLATEAAQSMATAYREGAAGERNPDLMNCRRCQFLEPCLAGRKAAHLEEQMLRARGFHQAE